MSRATACRSMYSDMSIRTMARLLVEEELGQRPRGLRLPHAGGAEKHEAPDRAVRILEARPAAPHRVRHRGDRVRLVHDAPVQVRLEIREPIPLVLEHARDRDARPVRDHLGNVLRFDLLLEERPLRLDLRQSRLRLGKLRPPLRQLTMQDLGRPLMIRPPLCPGGLDAEILDFPLERADGLDHLLLAHPACVEPSERLAGGGEIPRDFVAPRPAAGIALPLQRLPFDLELRHATVEFVDLHRHRVDFDAEPGRGFVDEVDRLVRQEAVSDCSDPRAERRSRGPDP